MRAPRALFAVGAAAVVPLAMGVTLLPAPLPAALPVAAQPQPAAAVLLVDEAPRAVAPPGGPAEVALGLTGLLVLAGATVSACAGGARVRPA